MAVICLTVKQTLLNKHIPMLCTLSAIICRRNEKKNVNQTNGDGDKQKHCFEVF